MWTYNRPRRRKLPGSCTKDMATFKEIMEGMARRPQKKTTL